MKHFTTGEETSPLRWVFFVNGETNYSLYYVGNPNNHLQFVLPLPYLL